MPISRLGRGNIAPAELLTIRDTLAEGRSGNPVTVREFLSWFDARRRGVSIVAAIRQTLEGLALATIPDFEEPWIDGLIAFHLGDESVPKSEVGGNSTAESTAAEEPLIKVVEPELKWEHREAGYRLSRFEAANRTEISVGPDASLREAVTTMMLNDFSQLPVMIGEREIKGVVTLSAIATRTVLGKAGERVSDFMVDATILSHLIKARSPKGLRKRVPLSSCHGDRTRLRVRWRASPSDTPTVLHRAPGRIRDRHWLRPPPLRD